jgi:hypothetical protein
LREKGNSGEQQHANQADMFHWRLQVGDFITQAEGWRYFILILRFAVVFLPLPLAFTFQSLLDLLPVRLYKPNHVAPVTCSLDKQKKANMVDPAGLELAAKEHGDVRNFCVGWGQVSVFSTTSCPD